MREKIILIGGGGHCKVIIDAVKCAGKYEIVGIIDRKLNKNEETLGVPVLGGDELLSDFYKKGVGNAFISFGSVGDCAARKDMYRKIKQMGFKLPVIVHPRAVIAVDVELGEGTFVAASATINSGTKIGKNAIINTSSSIDHDCRIGDLVHIAPGATLSGGVKIGEETHIGTGANLIQYVTIGARCMVGMGLTVRHDIENGAKYTGREKYKTHLIKKFLPDKPKGDSMYVYDKNDMESLAESAKGKSPLKVILLAKEEKSTVEKAILYLKAHFSNLEIFRGNTGDEFPPALKDCAPDILISYLSPWIIPREVLLKTKLWNINFHPGPPKYPGIGCSNFALYNGEATYGVTAHIMEEKVDTGKILLVKRFPLLSSDSVYMLSEKSYVAMLSVFYELMGFIAEKKALPECSEAWERKPYKREELEQLCKLDSSMSEEEVTKRIRATVYEGMPGSYVEIFGHKFEFNPER